MSTIASKAGGPNRESGQVAFLNISNGGVPKTPVLLARIDERGVAGDCQANLVFHGGRDRAVCLFSLERIDALRAEGHPITPGAIGENITTLGLPWDLVVPGVRLQVGDTVMLEITSYVPPCRKIRHALRDWKFSRVGQKHFPGWSRVYARVVGSGDVRPGDPVAILSGAGGEHP